MTMPAGVAGASVAKMAPRMGAGGTGSWNHMPGSAQGRMYWGTAVGALWGHCVASKMFPQVCPQGRA